MFPEERWQHIVKTLKENNTVSAQTLSQHLGVSLVTIRKDLNELEEKGLLKRTHGGAVSTDLLFEPAYDEKVTEYSVQKDLIAQAALKEIKPGEIIVLDAGTTTMAIAKALPKEMELTVATHALNIAQETCNKGIRTILIGGEIRKTMAAVGPVTIATLGQFYFNKAFIGTNGFSLDKGMTTPAPSEAEVKVMMLKQSQYKYLVTDSSKYDHVAFAKVADLNAVDAIITDAGLPITAQEMIREAKIRLILTKEV